MSACSNVKPKEQNHIRSADIERYHACCEKNLRHTPVTALPDTTRSSHPTGVTDHSIRGADNKIASSTQNPNNRKNPTWCRLDDHLRRRIVRLLERKQPPLEVHPGLATRAQQQSSAAHKSANERELRRTRRAWWVCTLRFI